MTSNELFTNMKTLWEAFEENHTTFTDKGNKAAATRARKSVGDSITLPREINFPYIAYEYYIHPCLTLLNM